MIDVEEAWPRISSLDGLAVRPAIVLKAFDMPSQDDTFM